MDEGIKQLPVTAALFVANIYLGMIAGKVFVVDKTATDKLAACVVADVYDCVGMLNGRSSMLDFLVAVLLIVERGNPDLMSNAAELFCEQVQADRQVAQELADRLWDRIMDEGVALDDLWQNWG